MRRPLPSAIRRPSLLVGLLAGVTGAPLVAQAPEGGRRTADSVPRIGAGAAFWRSLLIPGWGQAATGRWVTGATFTAWEGVCIMMTVKTKGEVKHIQAVGAAHVTTKKQEVQDWAVLLIFNHLFAGAEAFVSAHLQDFPRDLRIRAAPRGLMVSFPLPRP
jgi:hypothetical protein